MGLSDGNTGEGDRREEAVGAVWEARDQGAGSTKGQEDFMMAHMGEECLSHRAGGTARSEMLQRSGRDSQRTLVQNSAQAEVLASSHY